MAQTRNPATPTLPYAQVNAPQEDLGGLEQITSALHDLQLRLSNSEELAVHASHLVEYLQHIQQDLRIQGPEHAFSRLQPLRDLIFWLPPLILRPGESDLAPLALLSHLYASAIAVAIEPFFPEIGGAYLGSMSVLPLECVHNVLRTRQTRQPQDNGIQVALSLTDVPARILTSFRMRQRHNSQGASTMDLYRYSPQGSPYTAPNMPISSSTSELTTVYSHSPLHGPGTLQQAPSSYFTATLGSGDPRRDPSISSLVRAHSMNERNMSSGSPHAMGLVYGASAQYPRSSHEIPGSRMDYFGQVQAPYNQYGSMNMNTRFVAPSQLWT